MLGGFVTIGGSTYQITKIIGDGTTSGPITLSCAVSSGAVTALKLPLSIGILRVGNSTSVANPQELERENADYSTRRIGPNGSYQTLLRNLGRNYLLSSIFSQSDADSIVGIANSRRGLPLPVQVLADFTTERDLLSIYASVGVPAESYATKTGNYRSVSFSLTEALGAH